MKCISIRGISAPGRRGMGRGLGREEDGEEGALFWKECEDEGL